MNKIWNAVRWLTLALLLMIVVVGCATTPVAPGAQHIVIEQRKTGLDQFGQFIDVTGQTLALIDWATKTRPLAGL